MRPTRTFTLAAWEFVWISLIAVFHLLFMRFSCASVIWRIMKFSQMTIRSLQARTSDVICFGSSECRHVVQIWVSSSAIDILSSRESMCVRVTLFCSPAVTQFWGLACSIVGLKGLTSRHRRTIKIAWFSFVVFTHRPATAGQYLSRGGGGGSAHRGDVSSESPFWAFVCSWEGILGCLFSMCCCSRSKQSTSRDL